MLLDCVLATPLILCAGVGRVSVVDEYDSDFAAEASPDVMADGCNGL
jgi:hypothetical protein